MDDYKYWAFIAYSHENVGVATWLRRAIEGYVLPRRLIGRTGRFGAIPRKLLPVFRDHDELSSSSELGGVINRALEQSRYLIVVCSPASAKSKWVNEEIRYFKTLEREDRVLALIVGGEPSAGADPASDCFPPALRHPIMSDGTIGSKAIEPIAADIRAGRGTRRTGLLRLISGLIEVGYDELRQREQKRRLWQAGAWTAAIAVVGILGAASWQWRQTRLQAEKQAAHLAYLFDQGRIEALQDHPARAAMYLSAAYSGGLDNYGVRMLLGRVMPSLDAMTNVRVHADDEAAGATGWTSDGTRFLTLWRKLQIWDAKTGDRLKILKTIEYFSVPFFSTSPDNRRVLVGGLAPKTEAPIIVDLFDLDDGRLLMHASNLHGSIDAGLGFKTFSPGSDHFVLTGFGQDGGGNLMEYDSNGKLTKMIKGVFHSASYSFDGRRIVAGDARSFVSIWDAKSGHLLNHFDSGLGQPVRAFFSPNDLNVFVTSDLDKGKLKLFDSKTGIAIDAYGGHVKRIDWTQFSADGNRLLTHSSDSGRVWDLANGEELLNFRCDCTIVGRSAISADGRKVVARLDRTRAGIWDIDSRKLMYVLEGHSSNLNGLQFSPDNHLISSSAVDGDAQIWNFNLLRSPILAWLKHGDALNANSRPETRSGMFSPDGAHIVTAGNDGVARIWCGNDGKIEHIMRGHTGTVFSAVFSPDGKQVATGSADKSVKLWNVESGQESATLLGHEQEIRKIAYSRDGARLLAAGGRRVSLWDAQSHKLLAIVDDLDKENIDVKFSSDSARFVVTGYDGVPKIFDASNGRLLFRLKGHTGPVQFATWIDQNRKIVTAGSDGSVRIWSASDGKLISAITSGISGPGGFRVGVLSHDGESLLLAETSGEILLWRWRDARVIRRLNGHNSSVRELNFSPDDQYGVSSGLDGAARSWDLSTGETLQILSIPARIRSVNSAVFNADATQVVTTGEAYPGSAELWDLHRETRSPKEIARVLRCHSPWQLDQDQLVPHRPEPEACTVAVVSTKH